MVKRRLHPLLSKFSNNYAITANFSGKLDENEKILVISFGL